MVLEILKNNYERKQEYYYTKKIQNNTSKHKKKKKKKKTSEGESEKGYRNIESGNNEDSYNICELYKNMSKNSNRTKVDFSSSNINKKGYPKKNSKEFYRNSKENIPYGVNENEIFTEDIFENDNFENDNFEDDNFVEDENMDYKTYNSYTNPDFKLFSKYSSENIKNRIIQSNKKRNEQEGFYKKYKYNNERFKKDTNEHDSDIIRFLNNNKKSIEQYKKMDSRYQEKGVYQYAQNNPYGNGNYKSDSDRAEENGDYEGEEADVDDDEEADVVQGEESNGEDGYVNYYEHEDGDENEKDGRITKKKGFGKVDAVRQRRSYEDEDEYEEDDTDAEREAEEVYDEEEGEEVEEKTYEEEEPNRGDIIRQNTNRHVADQHKYESNFAFKRETKENANFAKREDIYFEKEIMSNGMEDDKGIFTAYNIPYGSGKNKNYVEKILNCKRNNEMENLKNMERGENGEFMKIYINENRYKKNGLIENIELDVKSGNIKNKFQRNTVNMGNANLSVDKYRCNNALKVNDRIIKFKLAGSCSNNEHKNVKYKEEMVNAIEYMNNNASKRNTYEDSNYCIFNRRGEIGHKDIKVSVETVRDINVEDKKKNNIKSFLDKIKHRKNNEYILKKEHSEYEESQKKGKKDKVKMKLTDILHTGTFGQFFHRSKSNLAKSLSPRRKRDNSFDEVLNSHNLEEFNLNDYKHSDINYYAYHHENTILQKPIVDERRDINIKELGKRLDYNSSGDSVIENGTKCANAKVDAHVDVNKRFCNPINIEKTSNPNNDIKYDERMNTQDKVKLENFAHILNDKKSVKNEDRNKIKDKNEQFYQNSAENSSGSRKGDKSDHKGSDVVRMNFTGVKTFTDNRYYYPGKSETNSDANSKWMNTKGNVSPFYQKLDNKSTCKREKGILGAANAQRKKESVQKLRNKEEEIDVHIDQTLSRKMIENNELKKRNENDEEFIVTPFYIKSKIDKVLKNSEIFERSARATFQQFDVKNKNFLHFSEIESLIQKLCYNLELPPVDSNKRETCAGLAYACAGVCSLTQACICVYMHEERWAKESLPVFPYHKPAYTQKILSIVYKDYDSSKNNSMNYTDFRQMYWDLLKQIKKKYYPTKNFKIKRNCFISRKKLGGYDYSTIYNYLSFKKILGCGAFGEVHLVEDNICKLFKVVKILKKKSMKNIKINEEINVLIYLDHPNIIKIFDVYENVDCTYIVMELCEGGELMNKIKNSQNFNEGYVKNIMFQILCAIAYMHSNNIAHKDLKPENILFKTKNDDIVKIIDFGLAELINKSEGVSKTAAGTVLYMAPEVFKKNFTIKCDIWSAGVIMFFLLTKSLPFFGNTYEEVKHSVFKDEPDYKRLKENVSQPALHILKLMLEKDYNRRPMAAVGYFDPVEISSSTLNNIKSYMKHSNIRNIIVNIMAHELSVINSNVKYINELFFKMDTNHNGSLSHREVYNVLSNAGIKKWDINRIVQALDINDRGSITYTEFIAGCYRWKNIEPTFLKAAFNKIDKDEDGYISKSDIVTLVHDKDIDSNDIDNFFFSVYTVKSGRTRDQRTNKISFEDFKNYLLSTF
ncbi:calcium-dependent protein kinase 6 (CDPK6) [Plasmodium ovale curtisi]|uniref:non-specific serine/threonine protein kinase n=1 Tax=Plasmodium ovale curtisi TaxID=864141 RepID=A0A1A8VSX1_PLAOA|nr:calcium-dependent protein kinase 6 (CDPK6) [Plasmodium ovale curtisi]